MKEIVLKKAVGEREFDYKKRCAMVQEYILNANDDNPAVYVGTYRKYNDGSLYGAWVDLTKFDNFLEFKCLCRELHKDEEDPEFMFQDFMNFPEEWYTESWMDEDTFEKIVEYGNLDEDKKEVYDAFLSYFPDNGIDDCMDRYEGKFDSEKDFAEHILNECYNIEDMMGNLSYYFDYDSYAYDLFRFDYEFIDGYVFRSC